MMVMMRIKSRFLFGCIAALFVIHLKLWLLELDITVSQEPASSYGNSSQRRNNKLVTRRRSSIIPFPPYPIRRDQITRHRNVVLLGPHDRYNFGDLLFTKVLVRLLQTRAYYTAEEIFFAGIIDTNMTKFGGEENIHSIESIQKLSIEDKVRGPYDIVYTGKCPRFS